MSDLSEFEAAAAAIRPGVRIWYDSVAQELDPEKRSSLDAALLARHISHAAISAVLRNWGHSVTAAQVGHYRRERVWQT